MNASPPIDHFQHLWALGYHNLISIVPPNARVSEHSSLFKRIGTDSDGRGKAPGRREQDGLWYGEDFPDYIADEYDLKRWKSWGAGVGVICRDDVKAIDADTTDKKLAKIIKDEIDAAIGPCPLRIGRFPKALYVVRVSSPFPYRMFPFGPQQKKRERVEILSTGKQFVAYGTHPGTNEPYYWPVPLLPYDDLPVVTAEVLHALFERLRTLMPDAGPVEGSGSEIVVDQTKLPGDPDLVKKAVQAIRNTTEAFPSRESYRDMGYRIKASLPDDEPLAFRLFSSWCEDWSDPHGAVNDPEIVASDWRRMKPPFRAGASKLYSMAFAASGGAVDCRREAVARKWHEGEYVSLFPDEETKSDAPLSLLGTPYNFPSACDISPREFLYGEHYQREYASVTIAPTKVGKSSLALVEALAMASGKALLGVKPEGIFRVRVWNGEDPRKEMDRRIAAIMQHYGLTREDLEGRLFVDSGRDMPLAVAHMTRDGAKIYEPVTSELQKALAAQCIDALFIDPFVKSHAVSENDNMAIDVVVREWNRQAGMARIALELVHHSRKLNGGEVSIDDSRGASALVSGARAARALARMTEKQSRSLGRTRDYKSLFRFADVSNNMAPPPAGIDEMWLELISVDLRNGLFGEDGSLIRKSDKVGVVTLSRTRGQVIEGEEATPQRTEQERRALAALASGDWKASPIARDSWAGAAIALAFDLDLENADQKAEAAAILSTWAKQGKVIRVSRTDKHRNTRIFIEVPKSQDNERGKETSPDDLFE